MDVPAFLRLLPLWITPGTKEDTRALARVVRRVHAWNATTYPDITIPLLAHPLALTHADAATQLCVVSAAVRSFYTPLECERLCTHPGASAAFIHGTKLARAIAETPGAAAVKPEAWVDATTLAVLANDAECARKLGSRVPRQVRSALRAWSVKQLTALVGPEGLMGAACIAGMWTAHCDDADSDSGSEGGAGDDDPWLLQWWARVNRVAVHKGTPQWLQNRSVQRCMTCMVGEGTTLVLTADLAGVDKLRALKDVMWSSGLMLDAISWVFTLRHLLELAVHGVSWTCEGMQRGMTAAEAWASVQWLCKHVVAHLSNQQRAQLRRYVAEGVGPGGVATQREAMHAMMVMPFSGAHTLDRVISMAGVFLSRNANALETDIAWNDMVETLRHQPGYAEAMHKDVADVHDCAWATVGSVGAACVVCTTPWDHVEASGAQPIMNLQCGHACMCGVCVRDMARARWKGWHGFIDRLRCPMCRTAMHSWTAVLPIAVNTAVDTRLEPLVDRGVWLTPLLGTNIE